MPLTGFHGHTGAEEFRAMGHALIDWIADYHKHIEQYPVAARTVPGEIRNDLPLNPPDEPESFENILQDLQEIIVPGLTHWQSPNFFAYFPANSSPPAILGDLASSGLGVQGMIWATSPACTELESHVMDWLVDMLGLPGTFKSSSSGGGVIQDTASSATLTALLTARERVTDFESNQTGVHVPLVAYASEHGHSSIEKAVKVAGIGKENLRLIKTNDRHQMDSTLLEKTIEEDIRKGFVPFFVCATIGTTSAMAIDPVEKIGEICRRHGLWLHVDAAMAGTAALCEEYRFINEGMEYADSYCFNPHKWMLTNFDCDCFYVRDKATLIKTLSILPEYLKNAATESGAVIDYRDWHIPLGRRFRALKLWFVIRMYGVSQLKEFVRHHVRLAEWLEAKVAEDPKFELTAPRVLNLLCFRLKEGDEKTQMLLERVNESGKLYCSHTVLGGRYTIRLCIGQSKTEARHVAAAWEKIQQVCATLAR